MRLKEAFPRSRVPSLAIWPFSSFQTGDDGDGGDGGDGGDDGDDGDGGDGEGDHAEKDGGKEVGLCKELQLERVMTRQCPRLKPGEDEDVEDLELPAQAALW